MTDQPWRWFMTAALLLLAAPVTALAQFATPTVYYNTFEFADMRSSYTWDGQAWFGDGPVLMAPGEVPSQPADLYTGNQYTTTGGETLPPVYVNDPSICHRGNWCIRLDAAANAGGTGGGETQYHLTLGNPLPSATTEHLFYSTYFKFPVGFQFIAGKFIYMREFDAPNTTVILQPTLSGQASTSTPFQIEVTSPSQLAPCNKGLDCTFTADGQWHQFEVELSPGASGTGILRLWHDGVLKLEYCQTCAAQITIDAPLQATKGNHYGFFYNGTCCGGVSTPAQSLWLDDIAVSTQRIGPLSAGGDTLAPAQPTNLQVVSP